MGESAETTSLLRRRTGNGTASSNLALSATNPLKTPKIGTYRASIEETQKLALTPLVGIYVQPEIEFSIINEFGVDFVDHLAITVAENPGQFVRCGVTSGKDDSPERVAGVIYNFALSIWTPLNSSA